MHEIVVPTQSRSLGIFQEPFTLKNRDDPTLLGNLKQSIRERLAGQLPVAGEVANRACLPIHSYAITIGKGCVSIGAGQHMHPLVHAVA